MLLCNISRDIYRQSSLQMLGFCSKSTYLVALGKGWGILKDLFTVVSSLNVCHGVGMAEEGSGWVGQSDSFMWKE